MRKSVFVLVTALCAFFFITSCQKELSFESVYLPSRGDSLLGDWKFVSMDVKSALTAFATAGGDTASQELILDFITKGNGGTLNIDSFNLNLADFSYIIDTISTYKEYFNSAVVDSLDEDIMYDAAPYTASSEYRFIRSDSIYLPNADFINLPIDLVLVPPVTGFKFRFEGDKLILTTSIKISEIDDTVVPPITYTSSASIVITFQKQ